MATRNQYFDQVKGILILLVIVGHVLLGSLEQNMLRGFIYFFHMPLFLAISGYFISQNTLSIKPYLLLKKYWHRMLLPFGVALLVYSAITSSNPFSIYPYYHLWYIPAIMLFIFYLKFINIIKHINWLFFIIVLLFISITVFFETYSQWTLSEHFLYKIMGDKRFYYFFSYFALGYWLGQNKKRTLSNKMVFAMLIPLILLNQLGLPLLQGASKVLINFIFIYLVIKLCETKTQHNTKQSLYDYLAQIGRISLPIYLWHVVPIMLLKSLELPRPIYYLGSIILFSIFIFVLLKLEDKSKILNKFIYGKN